MYSQGLVQLVNDVQGSLNKQWGDTHKEFTFTCTALEVLRLLIERPGFLKRFLVLACAFRDDVGSLVANAYSVRFPDEGLPAIAEHLDESVQRELDRHLGCRWEDKGPAE